MAKYESDLFGVQSYTQYFSWISLKNGIPSEAVSFTDSNGTVHIGRVKRNDHIIPGAVRNGVCRFFFEGSWQEERSNIEILKDNFGSADRALTWESPEIKDGVTVLSLNSEIGGTLPGGLYLIGRKKGSMEIMPVEIKEENRNFQAWHITYEGKPLTDMEVLSSAYHRMIAICPMRPDSDN